tara:strand:- start:8700 stop:9281 length:582 start_codon:yes stop_codon:yes gene_type:complete
MVKEEIFDKKEKKQAEQSVEKKKRKLTQAQLDGLAKGRLRMKEKREAEKLAKAKLDALAEKANKKAEREARKEKKKAIDRQKEHDIEVKVKREYMTKRKKKIQDFANLKYKWLEKAKTPQEYNDFKEAMNGITEDMIVNDKVDVYLGHYLNYKIYTHPTMKAKTEAYNKKIAEEAEEKKSKDNITIEITDGEN